MTYCIKLYDFIFSSNHCWVSFTGFSEAYNDVYENSIEKHASLFMNDNMEAEGINKFSLLENNSFLCYALYNVQMSKIIFVEFFMFKYVSAKAIRAAFLGIIKIKHYVHVLGCKRSNR